MMNLKNCRLRLKVYWEYFLFKMGFKSKQKMVDDLFDWLKRRGWQYGGFYQGNVDDLAEELEREYENIKKIKRKP